MAQFARPPSLGGADIVQLGDFRRGGLFVRDNQGFHGLGHHLALRLGEQTPDRPKSSLILQSILDISGIKISPVDQDVLAVHQSSRPNP